MAQSPNSRLKRVAVAGLTVAGASALSLAAVIPAGAVTTPPTNVSANNLIIGSGSSTTYSMMVQIGDLFNAAQTCPMTTANKTVVAAPLDFGCIAGGGGDPVAQDASPTATPENPWADVAVEEPAIGSSSGIAQLEKASGAHTTSVNVWTGVDFARSSRQDRTDASGDYTGLNFVAYAEDAVSWFHFLSVPGYDTTTTENNGTPTGPSTSTPNGINVPTPSANLQDLTQAQLKGIYSGAYTNWDQITDAENHTGANAPIVVFAPQEGSGTQATVSYYLGGSVASAYDESSTSNKVNCTTYYNSAAYQAEGSTAAVSGCQGPIVIFENELSSLSSSSFIGNQASQFLPAVSPISSAVNTVKDHRTTTVAATAWKGASSITVSSLTKLAPHNLLRISGVAGSYRVKSTTPASTNPTTHVTKPARVTFVAGEHLASRATKNASVRWIAWSTGAPATTSSALDEAVRADAIFLYSYGKWENQTNAGETGTGATATLNPANCGTENCGSMGVSPGYTATLGNLDSTPLNKYSDITQSFPVTRYLYNVYSNGSNSKIPAANAPTLNLVSEAGFICKPQNASIVDPSSATGATYLNELQSIIESQGFYPISAGDSSGVVNQTPLPEGNVTNPASGMTLKATGSIQSGTSTATATTNNYGLYMNVPGTGLTGGYEQDPNNSQPLGFCLTSTTDSSLAGS